MKTFKLPVFLLLGFLAPLGHTQSIDLPKYSMNNMQYVGAFRLPDETFGDARVAWTGGQIAVDSDSQTFFFSGSNKRSVAQFALPSSLSKSDSVQHLEIIDPPIQQFSNILDKAPTGNPNNVNRITGLALIQDKLIINAAVYYDANAENEHTTLVVEDPSKLSSSPVTGYLRLEGGNHSAGWISEIPSRYQEIFDSRFIAGHASNLPINSRNSMGPSAFLLDEHELLAAKNNELVATTKLLDFSINNLLHPDVNNESLTNNLWTELSYAYFGFIIPGTSTYLTIGQSGGHKSGIGYKITQPNGYNCGGFCAYDHKDYYNYYWLWDANDLIKSFEGDQSPSQIRPYEFSQIDFPHQDPGSEGYASSRVIGADFTRDGRLFIVLENADTLQSEYENQPIILVYQLFPDKPTPPSDLRVE